MSMRYYPAPGEDVRAAALSEALRYLEGDFEAQPADVVAAMCRTALAAQPAPEVPAGAEVATVLAGLLAAAWERLDERQAQFFTTGYAGDLALGMREIVGLIEAAQAATGARAAGGEQPLEVIRELVAMTAQPSDKRHDELAWSQRWDSMILRAHAVLASTPPAPSTPGVAELLAECRKRTAVYPWTAMRCAEIVRYLAPGGADGGKS